MSIVHTAAQAVELAKERQLELSKAIIDRVIVAVHHQIQTKVENGETEGYVHINHTIKGKCTYRETQDEVSINAPNASVLEFVSMEVDKYFTDLGYDTEVEWFQDNYCTTTVSWGC